MRDYCNSKICDRVVLGGHGLLSNQQSAYFTNLNYVNYITMLLKFIGFKGKYSNDHVYLNTQPLM